MLLLFVIILTKNLPYIFFISSYVVVQRSGPRLRGLCSYDVARYTVHSPAIKKLHVPEKVYLTSINFFLGFILCDSRVLRYLYQPKIQVHGAFSSEAFAPSRLLSCYCSGLMLGRCALRILAGTPASLIFLRPSRHAWIRLRPLPSKSRPFRHPFIILAFDAI